MPTNKSNSHRGIYSPGSYAGVTKCIKDRTMNLFALSENGASEFTFVVSRASKK
jgi:hypothetical protein